MVCGTSSAPTRVEYRNCPFLAVIQTKPDSSSQAGLNSPWSAQPSPRSTQSAAGVASPHSRTRKTELPVNPHHSSRLFLLSPTPDLLLPRELGFF
jgi:hypothetical protein